SNFGCKVEPSSRSALSPRSENRVFVDMVIAPQLGSGYRPLRRLSATPRKVDQTGMARVQVLKRILKVTGPACPA
ncbi:hypothetical protein, partial [Roseibium sp.]|uniref:hypothetical protein n=1 Tax=Roseibium sp. TaxID=1936156 RepID=UPI003297AD5F